MTGFEITNAAPSSVSARELLEFINLVSEGREVATGLESRVSSAHSLIFAKSGNILLGVAAVKLPVSSYRTKVFQSSDQLNIAQSFRFELGWVFVSPDGRNQGLSTKLVSAALNEVGTASIFATTRTDNEPMKRVLTKVGFTACGCEYPSKQNTGSKLRLYVRHGKDT